MSYLTAAETRRAIRNAVRHNREAPVEPKAIVWMDFPDTDDALFSGGATASQAEQQQATQGSQAPEPRLMGTVTEDDLVDAHVTSRWGTIGVKLDEAQERVSDIVYTRDRKPLLPILLAIVIAGGLVAQTSFATILGMGALLLMLVREVQR